MDSGSSLPQDQSQPACHPGAPGVPWDMQAEEQAIMYRRELDLSVFSLTFSEQRLQLPSEAGEGGA